MIQAIYRTQFKRDIKKVKNQTEKISKLKIVIDLLLAGDPLPKKYCDHSLSSNWKGRRECHVQPDFLLIYKAIDDAIIFERAGSHSELFK